MTLNARLPAPGATAMCDEWMPQIRLQLSIEQFRQLPRHPSYKYEYLDGTAYLSPRPKHYHALLDLASFAPPAESDLPSAAVTVRPARAEDFPHLEPAFAGAFHVIQPFASLDDATRRQAARQCLEKTRGGGDGPWIEPASFVATREDQMIGALLLTLLPGGDPSDWDSYYWREPPPDDCVARRLGRPHVTWVFVTPWFTGHGVGTALLAAAVRELRKLGYTELLSTFMAGNDSSMLWHWRNGFRLLPHPASARLMRERISRRKA